MRAWILFFLLLLSPATAVAQDLKLGSSGWQAERLSDTFVLLRTEIRPSASPSRGPQRQGLLVLTCDRQARRIRFQMSETPGKPSTDSDQTGRAILRGIGGEQGDPSPFFPRVRFFPDGSFEILEAIGFSDPTMRNFLQILQSMPAKLEVLLFKGPDTGAFLRGTVLQFDLEHVESSLVNIYGFEGLCYRAATAVPRSSRAPGQ